jgi:hypothetical protein
MSFKAKEAALNASPTKSIRLIALFLLCTMLYTVSAMAQDEVIDFESDRWDLSNAEIVEHMDRKCLMGNAFLKDVEFENGVIEVDIAVTPRSRSYPGIAFRMQSDENYERFYIRPHRSPYYSDALQYTPCFNGIDSWQLYNGDGCTA